jgi:hypothetical protein
MCTDGNASDRRRRGTIRQPDDNVLPVVDVAKPVGRRVLGHVPGIHDCVCAVVGLGASVDLAGVGFASTVGEARGFQSSAVSLMSMLYEMEWDDEGECYPVSPAAFTAGKGTQPLWTSR